MTSANRLCTWPALAGQQLVVHRLADQRVPEHVAVGFGQQHVGRHGRAQRPAERGAVQPGHRGQQAVADPLAARAGDPDHLLRLFRQPPQRPPSAGRAGTPAARSPARRSPTRASTNSGLPSARRYTAASRSVTRLAAGDLGHQLAGVLAGEPGQVHPA